MQKNLVRAGAILVVVLALSGCTRAAGLTEKADAEYRLACLDLGGKIRVVETPEYSLQCVFTFPKLPDEH